MPQSWKGALAISWIISFFLSWVVFDFSNLTGIRTATCFGEAGCQEREKREERRGKEESFSLSIEHKTEVSTETKSQKKKY